MKMIRLSLAAIAVWSCVASAYAQQQAETVSTAEASRPVGSVVVTARRYHVEPQEFRDYEYAYLLDNGETVRFSRRVGRFYLTIKGQEPVAIYSTAADHFMTKGGAKLVFTEAGDKLTIDRYEAIQLASGMQVATVPQAPK